MIALSNKKPVLTTSSNQLLNKDIYGWYVIALALIVSLGLSCILLVSEMVHVNIFYVVVDFSLCNDERFRDTGGCSGCSLQSVLSTMFVFVEEVR